MESRNRKTEQHPELLFARLFVGAMFLFEIFFGGWWKIPNPAWIGSFAGKEILDISKRAVNEETWPWFEVVLTQFIIPQAPLISYGVTIFQVVLALSLLFGFLVRPMAVLGFIMIFFIIHYGTARISPLFGMGFLLMAVLNTGKHYGMDRYLIKKKKWQRLIEMNWLSPKYQKGIIYLIVISAAYYFITIPMFDTTRMQISAMEIVVLLGLAGFLMGNHSITSLQKGIITIQVFVTYRLFQEIFIRTEFGANALPGWAGGNQWEEVLNELKTSHFLSENIMNTIFINQAGWWAAIFAVLHTIAAIMFILNWKIKTAAGLTIILTCFLIVLGFTRFAPFILGYAFILLMLKTLSQKEGIFVFSRELTEKYGMKLAIGFVSAAFGFIVFTFMVGLMPGGYSDEVGGMTAAIISLFLTIFSITFYAASTNMKANNVS